MGQLCSRNAAWFATILVSQSHSSSLLCSSCASPEVLQDYQHHRETPASPLRWPPTKEWQLFHCFEASTETPALQSWDEHLWNWTIATIQHLLHPDPTQWPSLRMVWFTAGFRGKTGWKVFTAFWRVITELDAHSLSYANSGTGEEATNCKAGWEYLKLVLPPKPLVLELPTMCLEHVDKLERKWEIPCPRGLHCRNANLPGTVTRQV